MERNKSILSLTAVAVVIILGGLIFWMMNNNNDESSQTTSTSQPAQSSAMDSEAEEKNIVSTAMDTPSLSTLVTAVKAADLVETLQSDGPFTVFAPTDEAFKALPAGTLDTLLKPENKEQLKSVLTYHAVAGKIKAADITDGQKITTVQGGILTASLMDGKVYLIDAKGNKATVSQADVDAGNGIVHVIDAVVLPQ